MTQRYLTYKIILTSAHNGNFCSGKHLCWFRYQWNQTCSVSKGTPVIKTTKKGKKSSRHLVPDPDLSCTDANIEETPLTSKGTPRQVYTGLGDQHLSFYLQPNTQVKHMKKKLGSSSPRGTKSSARGATVGRQDTQQQLSTVLKWLSLRSPPPTAFSPDACAPLHLNYQLPYVINFKHGTRNISDPVQSSSQSVNVQHETTPFN